MWQVTPLPEEVKEPLKAISYNRLQAAQTPTELQKICSMYIALRGFLSKFWPESSLL